MLLLLSTLTALAGSISLTADRVEAIVGDQITLSIAVQGSARKRPELPQISGFQVYPAGRSTQMSYENGRQSVTHVYRYTLVSAQVGDFRVGPVSAIIDGRRTHSAPLDLRILPVGERPTGNREAFVTVTLSETAPYVHEQVRYTVRFYRRVRVVNASLELPDLSAFMVEDVEARREYETIQSGHTYLVTEVEKLLLPTDPGSYELAPVALSVGLVERRRGSSRGRFFDDFFGTTEARPVTLRSEPVELQVRPLPPPPAEFSGLVGDFHLRTDLSRTSLRVGESTTVTAKISGSGNARLIAAPDFSVPETFKVYEDKPTGEISTRGGELSGGRTFGWALVPLAPGDVTLPELSLVTFDPDLGEYRTQTPPPLSLTVLPAETGEDLNATGGAAVSASEVKLLADDILPIHPRLDALPAVDESQARALWAGALFGPPLLYMGLLVRLRKRDRYHRDGGLRRRQNALRTARAALEEVGTEVAQRRTSNAAQQGSKAVRIYLGDKLGTEGGALTPSEARALLEEAGVDRLLAEEVERRLSWLERLQFGAGAAERAGVRELQQVLLDLVEQIDEALGKAR